MANSPTPPRSPSQLPDAAAPTADLPRVSFDDLAAGAKEVLIDHAGQVYRLRVTRNRKLILNK